jgi:hypothetical protein
MSKGKGFEGKGPKYTYTFLILGEVLTFPKTESQLIPIPHMGKRLALKKLMKSKLITRTKGVNASTGREVYYYIPTKKGLNAYKEARKKYWSNR